LLAPAITQKQGVTTLPPLHFTNLGGADGATPAQLGAQVLNIVMDKAASTGAAALAKQVGGDALGNAGGLLKGLFGQ
jgi:hypothetical protein